MFFKWNCVVRNLFLIAILAVFIAASALTAQPLPAPVLHVEPDLKLLGKGELRWFGLHVYDASLWVGGQTWSPNRTYALDLQYARDIPGKRLVDSSISEMRRPGVKDEDKLARWATSLARMFPDVKSGDRIVGLHVPGKGASFYHQGQPTGTIEDVEFSETFFAIWLDPRTREPALREALLGQR
jgi:hypothetical protein